MQNPVKQYIGMVELKMESLYLQELTFTKLKQEVIQKLAKCDPEIIELEEF